MFLRTCWLPGARPASRARVDWRANETRHFLMTRKSAESKQKQTDNEQHSTTTHGREERECVWTLCVLLRAFKSHYVLRARPLELLTRPPSLSLWVVFYGKQIKLNLIVSLSLNNGQKACASDSMSPSAPLAVATLSCIFHVPTSCPFLIVTPLHGLLFPVSY